MEKLQVEVSSKQQDICYYPEDFNKIIFLGMQTPDKERYCKNNWASSESGSAFWYPFVGGENCSIYTTVRSGTKIQELLDDGCLFFSFDSARELYTWMSNY